MNRSVFLVIPVLLLALAVAQARALQGEQASLESLPAPVQLAPSDGVRLHGFPRTVVFQWSKVRGASGYAIEIDYYAGQWSSQIGKPTFIKRVKDPTFTFDFYADQPGCWRVWALEKKNQRTAQVSAWSVFSFGPDNQLIPPPPPNTAPRFQQLHTDQHVYVPPGQLPDPPVFDPVTGEACAWPLAPVKGLVPPKPTYTPEPQFSAAARKAKVGGHVTLAVDIGQDGLVKRVCILIDPHHDLGLTAAKAVRTWRFDPARKDGVPIACGTTVEVDFHLY